MWRFATEATAAADTRPWSSAHGYSPKACKRIGECEMSFTCISVRACGVLTMCLRVMLTDNIQLLIAYLCSHIHIHTLPHTYINT